MHVTKHQPGMFSWADMPVLDIDSAQTFYTKLLGLEANATPIGPGMTYVALTKGGRSCCALYNMGEKDMQERGGPWWVSYFTVEDADATAERVKELGGAVLYEPFDVFEEGRMGIVQDSTGAVFAIWQPNRGIGAEVFGEPGALAWAELYTNDVQAAATFYNGLFGWNANQVTMPNGEEYTFFDLDGQPATGMMAIREEWGAVPPNWSIYLAVEDLDDALRLVEESGGRVINPPVEVETVGRFSFIQDPTGAHLSLMQLEQEG